MGAHGRCRGSPARLDDVNREGGRGWRRRRRGRALQIGRGEGGGHRGEWGVMLGVHARWEGPAGPAGLGGQFGRGPVGEALFYSLYFVFIYFYFYFTIFLVYFSFIKYTNST